jgi:chromosome segregation ATPase
MADDVSGGGNATSPVPRELRIDQLRESLDAAQASAAQSRISSEALHADIDALQAASDAANQAVDAYRQARTQLERQRAELTNAVEPMRKLVGSPESSTLLDEERQRLEDELKALREGVPAAEQAIVDARATLEKRRNESDRAAKEFQAIMDRPNSLETELQKADVLRTQISDVANSDRRRAYVLLRAFDAQLERAALEDVAAYRQELDDAWQDLIVHQEALRAAVEAEAKAKAALEQQGLKITRQEASAVDLVLQRAQAPGDEGGAARGEGDAAQVQVDQTPASHPAKTQAGHAGEGQTATSEQGADADATDGSDNGPDGGP